MKTCPSSSSRTGAKFSVSLLKTVVEEVEDPATEISLEAQQKKKAARRAMNTPSLSKTKDFRAHRRADGASTSSARLKEAERSQMYAEMQSKAHEIISAVVTNIEPVRAL